MNLKSGQRCAAPPIGTSTNNLNVVRRPKVVRRETIAAQSLSQPSQPSQRCTHTHIEKQHYGELYGNSLCEVVRLCVRGNSAHSPSLRVDIQRRVFCTITGQPIARLAARVIQRVCVPARYQGPPNSRTNPRPSYGLPAGSLFPRASRAHNALARTSHNPLQYNETHRCHHLSVDQKDIYARVSNHVFHTVEAVEPARPDARRNAPVRMVDAWGSGPKQGGWGGWGTEPIRPSDNRPSDPLSRLVFAVLLRFLRTSGLFFPARPGSRKSRLQP
jgi:hypothetical protein